MFVVLNKLDGLDQFLALEPEELGILFLEALQPDKTLNPRNEIIAATGGSLGGASTWMSQHAATVAPVCSEAWSWLEREGLVSPDYSQPSGGWKLVTRRGRKLISDGSARQYTKARALPRDLLHPALQGAPWNSFARGDYDTAVFQALKAVEVAVRDAAALGVDMIGVKLMRRAFDVDSGPLSNTEDERSEREALQHLFAGAIGSFKNPQSHRQVALEDPVQAMEVIVLASQLLRIVDERQV